MSKQSYRVCCCFQRRFKITEAEVPSEIKSIFQSYSENGTMNTENLQRFLKEVQGEDNISMEEAQSTMESIITELKHLHIFHRQLLTVESFFRYLFSPANSPLFSPHKVHHDMTAPLSHYFIYTSHNSYLTGNQLSSDCSDLPIIKALEHGVRVIELDMWPNPTKDNVDILHGRTLTTPVELIQCLKSIRQHAFVASEYPVILTLEDHLTSDLQAVVAEMVTQTFGDIIFSTGAEHLSKFPSPESLKKRIIISTKPPKEYLETKNIKITDDHQPQNVDKSSEEKTWGKEITDLKYKLRESNKSETEDQELQDEDDPNEENQQLKQNAPIEYRHLISIQTRKRKGDVKEWFKPHPDMVQRISLNEQKFEKTIIIHAADIIRFTQNNLLRIFPKAIRFDSSNYNPLFGWLHGAQMVALNMQGHDRFLWLMEGMFRANGGCGYVKKPDILLQCGPNGETFDPKKSLPVQKSLKVKIYMGEGWNLDFSRTHFDSYSPPDFYVKIGIAGVPDDCVVKKTKIVEDNWIPTWNEEFEFGLRLPELALLRIEIHEYDMSEKDDFGGQTCLPVSELKKGIRSVALYDHKGEIYKNVKLLMRFDFF